MSHRSAVGPARASGAAAALGALASSELSLMLVRASGALSAGLQAVNRDPRARPKRIRPRSPRRANRVQAHARERRDRPPSSAAIVGAYRIITRATAMSKQAANASGASCSPVLAKPQAPVAPYDPPREFQSAVPNRLCSPNRAGIVRVNSRCVEQE